MPNADIDPAFLPTGATRVGPNGPAAVQVNPLGANVQLLEVRVLAGVNPWSVLAKKLEVALLVGST